MVGKSIDDDDLISYINSGLNPVFHPFFTSYSFAIKDKPLTFDEFKTELLSYEMLVNSSQTSTDTNVEGFALYSQKPKNNSNKKNKYNGSDKNNQQFSQ